MPLAASGDHYVLTMSVTESDLQCIEDAFFELQMSDLDIRAKVDRESFCREMLVKYAKNFAQKAKDERQKKPQNISWPQPKKAPEPSRASSLEGRITRLSDDERLRLTSAGIRKIALAIKCSTETVTRAAAGCKIRSITAQAIRNELSRGAK